MCMCVYQCSAYSDKRPHDTHAITFSHKWVVTQLYSLHSAQRTHTHTHAFVDHRNEIINYEWCVSALVCVVCFIPCSMLTFLLLQLHFVFIIRRRSNYMSTFSIACVWDTKRSHTISAAVQIVRVYIFIFFYFSSPTQAEQFSRCVCSLREWF